jgi:hypothetical protein
LRRGARNPEHRKHPENDDYCKKTPGKHNCENTPLTV